MRVSVVIPSYQRGELLLQCVRALRALDRPADEIIVVDQTDCHPAQVAEALAGLAAQGQLRWERLARPSIPGAMNHGARLASGELVVFLDDDVHLQGELVAAHEACHLTHDVAVVAGRILQPWHTQHTVSGQQVDPPWAGDARPDQVQLHRDIPCEVQRFGAGNVSVRRDWLLRVGGFDENFTGAAYRFEADFAARVIEHGGRIRFEPAACIHHLHARRGGVRSAGAHGSIANPWHSAGRWYYLLRHPATPGVWPVTGMEVLRAVLGRRHIHAPWNAFIALVAELRGLWVAARAAAHGPRLGLHPERCP